MRYEIAPRKDASFMLPSCQNPATFLTHSGIKLPVYSIMTLNEFESVLPEESVAVQTTSVVPIANTEPDVGLQIGVINSSMLSIACGLKVAEAPF